MANNSDSIQDLVSAQRVMSIMQELDKKRKNPNAQTKNLKQIKEEQDQLILSGKAPVNGKNGQTSVENFNISLKQIKINLEALQPKAGENSNQAPVQAETRLKGQGLLEVPEETQPQTQGLMQVQAEVQVEQKTEMRYTITANASSTAATLTLVDKKQAETERYTFDFLSPDSFRITDKETMKSTTIWGDPHVDTNDQEGNFNGEFSDLTASSTYTTFLLLDGTRITFTAKDTSVIEKVDIIVGQQHLTGAGAAAKDFSEETGFFASKINQDGNLQTSLFPIGDLVLAGGDGNDWFDYRGRLLWGATSGPLASNSVGYQGVSVQVNYTQKVIRKMSLMQTSQ